VNAVFSPFGGPYSPERLMASRETTFPDGGTGFNLGDDAMAARMLCVRDPLYLAGVLEKKRLAEFPSINHRRVADLIVEQRNFIYLDHRGSFKTTLVDEVGTIFEWLRYPNYRQLFLQASLDLGKKLSGQVRHHLRETKEFRAYFPEYAIDTADEAGQIMSFNVPCKTSNTREASLTIGTPDTSLSMTHYDVIRGSDVSNETNNPPPCGKGTIEEALKIQQWVATTDGLLESKVINPFAHKTFDGTRWSEVDLWGYLIENDKRDRYAKVVSGVTTVPGPDGVGRFVSTVPGFTHEILQEIRDQPTMSSAMWAANYANSPIVGEGAMQFRQEWFHDYEEIPKFLDVAITVDPAWTEQDKNPEADRSAIVVSGIDSNGRLYVLAYRAGRWTPSGLFDHIYALTATWSPSWVGVEGGTQSVSFMETNMNLLRQNFPMIPVRTMPTKGQNKLVRVIPLHTHAEKFGIYVKKSEHDELIQEFLRFPSGKYKDLVDAMAYRMQDGYVPGMRAAAGADRRPDNPRNLMTGQDVFNILFQRGSARTMQPWESILASVPGRN
jgi:predicted phage terminase large subunit-like protein